VTVLKFFDILHYKVDVSALKSNTVLKKQRILRNAQWYRLSICVDHWEGVRFFKGWIKTVWKWRSF